MDDLAFLPAFALAALVTWLAVPPVIVLARRTRFYDHPAGYKEHRAATPYLGGLAVFAGFAAGALAFGHASGRFWVAFACAAALLAVGTLDDRLPVAPRWRVLAEVGAACALSAADLGWSVSGSEGLDLLLTVVWVVGLCNAFNLMDNLDGATGTVAGVSAAGIGALALAHGDPALAAFAFALSGACAGFLPHNLAGPARIFLGDGGSLPTGFLVAAGAMAASDGHGLGVTSLLVGALLVGLVILDTTLVVVSRRRAGVPLVTAGRDHLTHRLLLRLGSPRRVALALAIVQALLCIAAIAGADAGRIALTAVASVVVLLGMLALGVLDSPAWRPRRAPLAPRLDRVPLEGPYEGAPSTVESR
jgi:UDP-GlcNAc:undecaprenyl-phosphate/decaprenyl-phosphate GlcNAc-1-phosphate transferase